MASVTPNLRSFLPPKVGAAQDAAAWGLHGRFMWTTTTKPGKSGESCARVVTLHSANSKTTQLSLPISAVIWRRLRPEHAWAECKSLW